MGALLDSSAMRRTISALRTRASTPTAKKAIRYSLVSVVAVAVSQTVFVTVYSLLHWSASRSAMFSTAIGAIPSYFLNRLWVWGKKGRSHLWREIVPFWTLAFISLAFSAWASGTAERYVETHDVSKLVKTALVTGAYFGSFAVLWVVKFIIFNKVLFTKDEDLQAALANEVVG